MQSGSSMRSASLISTVCSGRRRFCRRRKRSNHQSSPRLPIALVDYLGGFKTIAAMVGALMEDMAITVPVVLHLDHGSSAGRCRQAIDAGFSSVMIDGSHQPIDENIAMTKEVTDYAAKHGVSVEAEVGTVGGMEDGLVGGVRYADIKECERIVKETNIDALAAALGSVHGKYQGEPNLGFKEMEAISRMTHIPSFFTGHPGFRRIRSKKPSRSATRRSISIRNVWSPGQTKHAACFRKTAICTNRAAI